MGCLKLSYEKHIPQLKIVKLSVWNESKSYAEGYRFGFNGKEKDDEINVGGGSYDFGARICDVRLGGRFFSVDPKTDLMPSLSPYSFAANSPIQFIDENGELPKVAIILATKNNTWQFSEHKAALEKSGYKVVFAETGKQALKAMKENSTPESPTSDLILISHGSPGGLASGGGGIWTESEVETFAKENWKTDIAMNVYMQQNGITVDYNNPNYDWNGYYKDMEGFNEQWIDENFEKNKTQISNDFKTQKGIITPTDIANAQNTGGFETQNLTIVLGGCNLAGTVPLDGQQIFSSELAVSTNSTVWASQGKTGPDHSKNTKTNDKIGTTTSSRTTNGSWIKTDSNGTRTDTGKQSLNLCEPE
jgi:RHS repeat-associated protein